MEWSRRGTGGLVWGAVVALGVMIGCGGEEEVEISGAQMGAQLEASSDGRPNRPPRIERLRLTPRSPHSGDLIEAIASASDPDGDPTSILYEWTLDGTKTFGVKHQFQANRVRKGARIEVRATPRDGKLDGEARVASVEVDNAPPTVTEAEYDLLPPIRRGQTVSVLAEAEDRDADEGGRIRISYLWYVNGNPSEVRASSYDTSRLRSGDRLFARVVAHDGDDPSEPFDTEPIVLDNLPPTIVSTPATSLGADGIYHYAVQARDGDGDRGLRYELAKAPAGMQIDAVLGTLEWRPKTDQVGEHIVEIHVIDSKGARGGQVFDITVADATPEAEETTPASPQRY